VTTSSDGIIFQLVLLLMVIGGIVVESIATPAYCHNYVLRRAMACGAGYKLDPKKNWRVRGSWSNVAKSAFRLALLIEFVTRVVVDEFMFTPNAYVWSISVSSLLASGSWSTS